METDEFPQSPSKRMRLDAEHNMTAEEDMQLDDPDDFYDDDHKPALKDLGHNSIPQVPTVSDTTVTVLSSETATAPSTLPGLDDSVQDVKPDNTVSVISGSQLQSSKQESGTADAADNVDPANHSMSDGYKAQSTTAEQAGRSTDGNSGGKGPATLQAPPENPNTNAEFLEAAKQNKTDANAEWRYDSSDAETSSDDSSDTSSDSSSEEDSDEEDAVLLDPAEAARMLMKEEGGDDGDGDKAPRGPIKTQNEVDVAFTKPNITITPEMTVVELGLVDNIIGNLVLIKANTSGEYRVLESGSLLCLADRTVAGEVWEPLGRVHDPMYSVGFQQQSDIEELGITRGTTIYYVEQHSTYVFTQSIKNLKGSDASNMHDEEAYGDEVEFSDDEKEAEYKRNLKQARQAKRAAAQGTQQGPGSATGANGYTPRTNTYAPSVQTASYPDAISYDDGDAEDMYKPLTRPDNLSQMMGASPPPLARRNHDSQRGGFENRGRGDRHRGRGRGRGDRGGRGGGFQRGRGDRNNSYNREQQNNSNYGTQQQHDGGPTPQQPSYPPVPQSWSPNASQQPGFNFPQRFPPPPPLGPPPAAMYTQQAQAVQQQSFDPQAWAQYIQHQAAQAQAQSQQQQQYLPQGAAPAQAGTQAAQNSLSSLIQSLTQNGNRQA